MIWRSSPRASAGGTAGTHGRAPARTFRTCSGPLAPRSAAPGTACSQPGPPMGPPARVWSSPTRRRAASLRSGWARAPEPARSANSAAIRTRRSCTRTTGAPRPSSSRGASRSWRTSHCAGSTSCPRGSPSFQAEDFVLLRFVPDRLEVIDFARHVTPEPFGQRALALERRDGAWVPTVTAS